MMPIKPAVMTKPISSGVNRVWAWICSAREENCDGELLAGQQPGYHHLSPAGPLLPWRMQGTHLTLDTRRHHPSLSFFPSFMLILVIINLSCARDGALTPSHTHLPGCMSIFKDVSGAQKTKKMNFLWHTIMLCYFQ